MDIAGNLPAMSFFLQEFPALDPGGALTAITGPR